MSFEDIIKTLIPTFKEGQRVRIHNIPIEARCPFCGQTQGISETDTWDTVDATIIEDADAMYETATRSCGDCGYAYTRQESEGWYAILDDDGTEGVVPYTLLSPIEEESE